jgi:adenylosuccinate lyase
VPRGNQTEFKGGAPGGPPLATNHDDKAKAVEYLLQYELGVLLKAGRLEDLMKVKEFIHFGLISQDINNTCYPLMILRSWRCVYMRKHVQTVSAVDLFVCKWGDAPHLRRGWGRS